jgi:hypothetical protein
MSGTFIFAIRQAPVAMLGVATCDVSGVAAECCGADVGAFFNGTKPAQATIWWSIMGYRREAPYTFGFDDRQR